MIYNNNKSIYSSRECAGHNHFITIICLSALLILSFLTKATAAETKKILVLHSYHQGLVWTDDMMEGIYSVFNKYSAETEIHVEYMDTKRYFDGLNGKYLTRLRDMYKYKYYGVGMPDDIDYRKSASLGMNLVDALVRQVSGELELHKDDGTRFDITFSGRKS